MTLGEEIQHYSRIILGCESINNVLNNGGKLTEDGRYAQTVLRLHAEDAGNIAGTESFLDSFKKGAESVKDWVLKLVKAIREFIAGKKKEQPKPPSSSTQPAEEKTDKQTKSGEKYIPPINALIAKAEKADGLNSVVSTLNSALSSAKSGTVKDVSQKLHQADDRILSELQNHTNKLNQLASKDNAQAEINKEIQAIKVLESLSTQLGKVIERAFNEMMS